MTVRCASGFESESVVMVGEGWDINGGSFNTVTKHTSGSLGGTKSFRMTNANFIGSPTVAGAGAAEETHLAFFPVAPWAGTFYIQVYDSGGTAQASITLGPDALIRIRRGSWTTGGVNIATSASAVSLDAWHTMKVVWTCREAASAGRIQVFLNGSTTAFVDTGAGVDCRASAVNDFARVYHGMSGVGTIYIDSFVWGSTGTIPDEPLYITPLRPTSDGATTDFAPSTGSDNYALVDNDPVNTAVYNEATVAGSEDHLGLANLGSAPTSVLGLKVSAYVTGDGTLTNMRTLVNSGGTVAYGTNRGVSSGGTYSTVSDYYDTDPNTVAAWAAAAVDAVLAGYEANT
jgi:hypothetical protein